jgi:SAM-dependent methyltransferase
MALPLSLRDLKRTFPGMYDHYVQHEVRKMLKQVAAIVASPEPPQRYDAEFDTIQSSFKPWWGDYGYDAYSTWARGCERAVSLLKLEPARRPALSVFEAGTGDGMTGWVLASYGHQVTLNDADDWRDDRARSLPFVQGSVCSRLPLAAESFDLLLSYNGFEHIEDPKAGLEEMVRLCKPGGHIFIQFDPLFCSPLGLHAFSFMMPYPQFLFSEPFIDRKVKELGVNDLGQTQPFLQPTNKWRLGQFRALWRSCGCDVVDLSEVAEHRFLGTILKFPKAFSGNHLTVEDVTVKAITVLLRKK